MFEMLPICDPLAIVGGWCIFTDSDMGTFVKKWDISSHVGSRMKLIPTKSIAGNFA